MGCSVDVAWSSLGLEGRGLVCSLGVSVEVCLSLWSFFLVVDVLDRGRR